MATQQTVLKFGIRNFFDSEDRKTDGQGAAARTCLDYKKERACMKSYEAGMKQLWFGS